MSLIANIISVYSHVFGSALKAIAGWTDGANCSGGGNYVVNFNKDVFFTDHTGISIVNTTINETAVFTGTVEASPSGTLSYTGVTWITQPIAGDVIEWQYNDLTGNYADGLFLIINNQVFNNAGVLRNLDGWLEGGLPAWSDPGDNYFISNDEVTATGAVGSFSILALDIIPSKIEADIVTSAEFTDGGFVLHYTDNSNYILASMRKVTGTNSRLDFNIMTNGVSVAQSLIVNYDMSGGAIARLVVEDDGTELTMYITTNEAQSITTSGMSGGRPTRTANVGLTIEGSLNSITVDNLQITAPGDGKPMTSQTLLLENCLDAPILKSSLRSITSAIGVNAILEGTGSFTPAGFSAGVAGNLRFEINDPALQARGRIQFYVSDASKICTNDVANQVSGSYGDPSTAITYFLTTKDSTSANASRIFKTNGVVGSRHNTTDVQVLTGLTTRIHPGKVKIELWWTQTLFGLNVADGPVHVTARTVAIDAAWTVILGSDWGGISSTQDLIYSDILVDRLPGNHFPTVDISLFGDSFVSQLTTPIQQPRWDATGNVQIQVPLLRKKIGATIAYDGTGGASICDSFTNNLSDFVAAWLATNPEYAVIMAANNDSQATDAEVLDAVTGTEANLKSWITSLHGNGVTKHVVVTTAGSLRQDNALDTVGNNGRRVMTDAIIKGLVAWADANLTVGFVSIVDLYTLLGSDVNGNVHYKGHWDTVGNLATGGSFAPVPLPDDRHMHSSGEQIITQAIANNIIARVPASVFP